HTGAFPLQQIHIRIHPGGGRWTERPGWLPFRGLGRTGIVDRILEKIFRYRLAGVDELLESRMGNVASNNDGAVQQEWGRNRMLGELGQDSRHRLIQVDADTNGLLASASSFCSSSRSRNAWPYSFP